MWTRDAQLSLISIGTRISPASGNHFGFLWVEINIFSSLFPFNLFTCLSVKTQYNTIVCLDVINLEFLNENRNLL